MDRRDDTYYPGVLFVPASQADPFFHGQVGLEAPSILRPKSPSCLKIKHAKYFMQSSGIYTKEKSVINLCC